MSDEKKTRLRSINNITGILSSERRNGESDNDMNDVMKQTNRTTGDTPGFSLTKDISMDSKRVEKMIPENPVLVLGHRGCCMCHVMKRLLLGLGVNPTVCEMEREDEVILAKFAEINGSGGRDWTDQFPVVFIGGRLVGGIEKLMTLHITGELIPILKQAGALWL